jgi:uncharacterized membrane protein YedE/YeeE
MSVVEWISQPWHWAVSGALIALVMFLLTWMGRMFGISSTYTVLCSIAGAGKYVDYFKLDLKQEAWRLYLAAGAMLGGVIAFLFLPSPDAVNISQTTIDHLATWGISYPDSDQHGQGFLPTTVFNYSSVKGIVLSLLGGFLIGFGTRYGEGCTSGHAISGLSHLRLPSLITVIGFFIGGLIMTHLIMPLIF